MHQTVDLLLRRGGREVRTLLKVLVNHLQYETTENSATSSNDFALVIERGDAGKVGNLSEDCVEGVGLFTGLGRSVPGGGPSLSAGGASSSVRPTLVHELVANELTDDVEVLSGTVVVAHCVTSP